MTKFVSFVAGAAFAMVAAGPALAGSADVYVVHGINGQDLGADPALPVDVSVNGACALQEFTFGEIVGPIELPAPASYDIEVSLANVGAPCSNAPVIVANGVPLLLGQTASIVAHLNDSGQPTASAFNNNISELDDKARVAVHHTAAAVPVDVIVQRGKKRKKGSLTIEDLANGEQAVAEVRPGRYKVSINVANTNTTVLGPVRVRFREEVAHFIYAVGTPGSTFELLTLLINTDDDDDDDDDDDEDDDRDD